MKNRFFAFGCSYTKYLWPNEYLCNVLPEYLDCVTKEDVEFYDTFLTKYYTEEKSCIPWTTIWKGITGTMEGL